VLDVVTLIEAKPKCNIFLKIFLKLLHFCVIQLYFSCTNNFERKYMTPQELVNYFGSPTKAAAAIDVTSQTVLNWIEKGVIPYNAQKAIAYDTKNKLKPDSAEIGKGM
jgi:hypothetical protein